MYEMREFLLYSKNTNKHILGFLLQMWWSVKFPGTGKLESGRTWTVAHKVGGRGYPRKTSTHNGGFDSFKWRVDV